MTRTEIEQYINKTVRVNYWTESKIPFQEQQEDGSVRQILKRVVNNNSITGIIDTVTIRKLSLILLDDDEDHEVLIKLNSVDSIDELINEEEI